MKLLDKLKLYKKNHNIQDSRNDLDVDGNLRIIKLDLDENVLLAIDSDRNSLVRLGVIVGGQQLLVNFPTLGDWDSYCISLSRLLNKMAVYAGDLVLPNLSGSKEEFQTWMKLCAGVVLYKGIHKSILKIFCKYLRPTLVGNAVKKRWLKTNLTIDSVVKILISILAVDNFVKKNVQFALKAIFPQAI